MQLNAQAVADWAIENGIELNINKIKVMIFGRLQPIVQIEIYGIALPYVEIVKNLGILMTATLNWQPQVTVITDKIYSTKCLGSI